MDDQPIIDDREYDQFMDVATRRMSIRKLRPDPIPDDHIHKVLEAGRWAMSGANSQPWEFVVVKDPEIKAQLFDAYSNINDDFIFWMEQMRQFELRHPAFQVDGDSAEQHFAERRKNQGEGWSKAPALIVILGDGRRQWGTVLGALSFGRRARCPIRAI